MTLSCYLNKPDEYASRWDWQVGDAAGWDQELARLGGHPLQSALWGDARARVEHIPQLFLYCRGDDGVVRGMARVERRRFPVVGDVAWIPKGPVISEIGAREALTSLQMRLKQSAFIACTTDRYVVSEKKESGTPKTIWLDLTVGLEALSKGLDAQWRYGARRALREGVVVRVTTAESDVAAFFQMCKALSATKGFSLPGSESLMQELVRSSSCSADVGMTLYLGEVGSKVAGGALVARCGKSLHYLWGASDRRYSKFRVSEAVQWQVIQDGVAAGMALYDLEGIDPIGNPGVYEFKRKMGGCEVALEGMETTSLSWLGACAVAAARMLGRIS